MVYPEGSEDRVGEDLGRRGPGGDVVSAAIVRVDHLAGVDYP